jgi:hypothetical protein
MDPAAYHVVYVDNRLDDDLDGKYLHKSRLGPHDGTRLDQLDSSELRNSDQFDLIIRQGEEVRHNIKSILSAFSGGTLREKRIVKSFCTWLAHTQSILSS